MYIMIFTSMLLTEGAKFIMVYFFVLPYVKSRESMKLYLQNVFLCPLGFQCNGHLLSLGAHSACQFSSFNIWAAREWATPSFNGVHQSTMLFGLTTSNILCIFINADELISLLVPVVSSHKVPMILFGPARWTIIPCGHHKH